MAIAKFDANRAASCLSSRRGFRLTRPSPIVAITAHCLSWLSSLSSTGDLCRRRICNRRLPESSRGICQRLPWTRMGLTSALRTVGRPQRRARARALQVSRLTSGHGRPALPLLAGLRPPARAGPGPPPRPLAGEVRADSVGSGEHACSATAASALPTAGAQAVQAAVGLFQAEGWQGLLHCPQQRPCPSRLAGEGAR